MPTPTLGCFTFNTPPTCTIVVLHQGQTPDSLSTEHQDWLKAIQFAPKTGKWALLPPTETPTLLVIVKDSEDWRTWADIVQAIPPMVYAHHAPSAAMLRGWASGSYHYQHPQREQLSARLILPENFPQDQLFPYIAEATVRRLIDTPANLMTTDTLADEAIAFLSDLVPNTPPEIYHPRGKELLTHNLPLIYHVGKASEQQPQLLQMRWFSKDNTNLPLITIIGKGMCFDSGGLDIKPRTAMLTMKKDMGGAAHAIGLTGMLLKSGIQARIQLILGIAENAISANAFRPGDIYISRNKTSIEIGDTDAEGRLVLADCLSLAADNHSEIIVDFATLTGAARVALGADLPAMFCNDDALANTLCAHDHDPLWRMPLHAPYREIMHGRISDLNSAPSETLGGAITAALFLENFVPKNSRWVHIDLMAYSTKKIHGRSAGAAAQGIYALCEGLKAQFA